MRLRLLLLALVASASAVLKPCVFIHGTGETLEAPRTATDTGTCTYEERKSS